MRKRLVAGSILLGYSVLTIVSILYYPSILEPGLNTLQSLGCTEVLGECSAEVLGGFAFVCGVVGAILLFTVMASTTIRMEREEHEAHRATFRRNNGHCNRCKDDGKCPACGGRGRATDFAVTRDCRICYGSGHCKYCYSFR